MTHPNRFFSYDASFDALEVMRRNSAPSLIATPGYLTNFLGVLIDPAFAPDILRGRSGSVEDTPIPANWHADIAEWGGALRAVELASGTFTAVECGCGWACWLNNTGVAARRRGLAVHLVGIEADEQYVAFAHQSLTTNGFVHPEFTIFHGVAAAREGTAYFPKAPTGGTDWGRAPVFSHAASNPPSPSYLTTHCELPCIALSSLSNCSRVDLLHIDIQGGEYDLVSSSLDFILERVAYMVIGTHSRALEGRLHDLLHAAGLILEIDRPAFYTLTDTATLSVDGVQAWRNRQLTTKY